MIELYLSKKLVHVQTNVEMIDWMVATRSVHSHPIILSLTMPRLKGASYFMHPQVGTERLVSPSIWKSVCFSPSVYNMESIYAQYVAHVTVEHVCNILQNGFQGLCLRLFKCSSNNKTGTLFNILPFCSAPSLCPRHAYPLSSWWLHEGQPSVNASSTLCSDILLYITRLRSPVLNVLL